MMRVLVTGFEPYGDYPENSSWEVAKEVACSTFYPGIEVVCVQLPVSFQRVANGLHDALQKYHPDFILMLGQSGGSDKIKLERIAINMMDAKMPDNDGYIPHEELISADSANAWFANVPVKSLCGAIAEQGIPVKISNSCGLYVCNRLYFEALTLCQSAIQSKALFVHLPYYEGQPSAKVGKPTVPLEVMVKAMQVIINQING